MLHACGKRLIRVCLLEQQLHISLHSFENFEVEELILYPSVEERLKKLKVNCIRWHRPESIPTEQI